MTEKKYNAKDLEKKIDEYFNTPDVFHSFPGMCIYLGITTETANSWRANKDGKTEEHSRILKNAEDRRQQELLEIGITNKDKSVFAMFLLKQPNNGGLRDKPKDDDDVKDINITINGVDIGSAFK